MAGGDITSITHATNAAGIDELTIEQADGTTETRGATWAEARDLALRARLDAMELLDGGTTRWRRRA